MNVICVKETFQIFLFIAKNVIMIFVLFALVIIAKKIKYLLFNKNKLK